MTLAFRHDRAILCGRCADVALAEAHADGTLTFPLDAHQAWKGWKRATRARIDAPGGTWRVADPRAEKRPHLHGLLDMLPAIIECPNCGVDNLLDPGRLKVPALQIVAKTAGPREITAVS
jgi:hypothetical protein